MGQYCFVFTEFLHTCGVYCLRRRWMAIDKPPIFSAKMKRAELPEVCSVDAK